MSACSRFVTIGFVALLGHLTSTVCFALEGGLPAAPEHFGVVGTIAPPGTKIGFGFSAVQVAPRWVLTAAHIGPQVGAIFSNDYGMSGISEVLTFPSQVPTVSPIPGAVRDDIALLHLAKPILSPYFPRLADEGFLPRAPLPSGFATLVSNNPSANRRRFGVASLQIEANVPGYSLAVFTEAYGTTDTNGVRLVSGDSGSPMFLGRLLNTNASSVLVGVASEQGTTSTGVHLGIYTRIGAYRRDLDRAVEASGEHLCWTEGVLSHR